MQILTLGNVISAELFIGSRDNISDAHIKVSYWIDSRELFLQEIFKRGTVVKTAFEEESSGNTTEPTFIKVLIRSTCPELLHSSSSSLFLTFAVIGKDHSINCTA